MRAAQHRTRLRGSDRPHGETHQTLLAGAVDARELSALDDVLAVAGYGPGRLVLSGVPAVGEVREPVEQRRAGLTVEVGVAAHGVVQDGAGRVRTEGQRMPELPRVVHRPAADVGAEVRVADGVDDAVGGERAVGVPVAVLHPVEVPGHGIEGERALEVATGPEDVAGPVYRRAVGREAQNRGLGAGVLDDAVNVAGDQRTAGRVDGGQTVRGAPVDVGEGATRDDPRLVR